VLNVTFSKGPKPSKDTATVETHKLPEKSKESNKESGQAVTEETSDNTIKKNSPRIATNEQRIVSQSQHIGERPQVILEQNRHIVPFSLFDAARRSRNTELPPSHDRGPYHPANSREIENNPPPVFTPYIDDSSSGRPALPSTPSWGKTSVNSKFGEQILLSVFAPTPIQHHKKPAKSHTTLSRVREPSIRRRGHHSADPIRQSQDTESIPTEGRAKSAQAEDGGTAYPESVPDDKYREILAATLQPDAYSTSASAFEDSSHGLERVRTPNSISSEESPIDRRSNKIRRRHSGIGLRRRGTSVHDKTRGNLEYYDEEGYGGDGEEEVSQMEPNGDTSITVSKRPSSAVPKDPQKATSSITTLSHASEAQAPRDMDSSLHRTSTNGSGKQPGPAERSSPSHLPLNPKEAQLAKPDQRVVLFLLLEDLTADMGRPCVLDLKMGTRQYGIEASPKKVESQRRKCKTTTSQQLGVRICGMQTFNVKKQQPAYEDKYFGRDLKAGREFREALTRFLYDGVSYSSVTKRIPTILEKISKLESMVRRLPGYRFYASSLLMLYDAEPEKSQRAKEKDAKVKAYGEKKDGEKPRDKDQDRKGPPPIELKIVDFANCVTGEDPLPPDASCPPFHPGTVDRGYLRGLRTLKMYFHRILRDITESEFLERGESEATGVDMLGAAGTQGGSEVVMEEDDGEVSI
jgi:inositol-hexakisphosphate kinase